MATAASNSISSGWNDNFRCLLTDDDDDHGDGPAPPPRTQIKSKFAATTTEASFVQRTAVRLVLWMEEREREREAKKERI